MKKDFTLTDIRDLGRSAGASGRSLAAELVGRLEDAIVGRELHGGQRLGTKSELRQQLGVAYGTLNEVIRALQLRGLVELRPGPGGGVFVAQDIHRIRLARPCLRIGHDARSVWEASAVRIALEPAVAGEAADGRTDADVAALQDLLEKMAARRDDPPRFVSVSWELHRQIARSGRNAVLTRLYCNLVDFLAAGPESEEAAVSPEDVEDQLRAHARLVKAVSSGDRRRALRAVQRRGAGPAPGS